MSKSFNYSLQLKPYSGSIFLKNNIFKRKSTANAAYMLDKKLEDKGVLINTIDIDGFGNTDAIIFFDVPYPWEFRYWIKLVFQKTKKLLFVFESPTVNPFNHFRWVYTLFDKVYTWNANQTDGNKVKKYNIPQFGLDGNIQQIPFQCKMFAVMINSNKKAPFPFKVLSISEKDLYFERVKLLDFFQINAPKDIHLYGYGWDKKGIFRNNRKYSFYQGSFPWGKKIDILSRYKFALCFENSVAPGYLTEKIFDCFKAGCVPVYWGAPDVYKYIPQGCFIDASQFDSYADLYNYLQNIDENTYIKYITNVKEFIYSRRIIDTWSQDKFIENILDFLDENFKKD